LQPGFVVREPDRCMLPPDIKSATFILYQHLAAFNVAAITTSYTYSTNVSLATHDHAADGINQPLEGLNLPTRRNGALWLPVLMDVRHCNPLPASGSPTAVVDPVPCMHTAGCVP
jgi:hypothetical protein